MKKHTVIALLVMCLSACAAEKAPIKESNPQTDTTSQIKQPKATANPYQDVFTGVAPILGVQASEVKPDVTYNYNYDSTQADGSQEDEHIPAFTLENPITRLSNEEENALEEKVLTVMEGLGWKMMAVLMVKVMLCTLLKTLIDVGCCLVLMKKRQASPEMNWWK